jgi:hypothetical protein
MRWRRIALRATSSNFAPIVVALDGKLALSN